MLKGKKFWNSVQETRFSEEKCYRQSDEKIAALFFTDVRAIYIHHVISNADAHNALFSWLKNKIIPCVCYNNKENKNLFLWHNFVPKSLNTWEKTHSLVFIRALQSNDMEINGHRIWLKENAST